MRIINLVKGLSLMRSISNFLKSESGASAAEYALILALVAVAIVTAIGLLATSIEGYHRRRCDQDLVETWQCAPPCQEGKSHWPHERDKTHA